MVSRSVVLIHAISAIAILSNGCNVDPRQLSGVPKHNTATVPLLDDATPPTHIVFAGIDVLSSPWQSSVFSLDLESLTTSPISTGESGDPLILKRSGAFLLINRSFDSQNFRTMSWDEERSVQLGTQIQYNKGGFGDPHDVVILDDDSMLAANYSAGNLVVVNRADGSITQTISENWDLPKGAKMRPEALVEASSTDGKRYIFVIHQALSFGGGGMLVDGSQAAFVLLRGDDNSVQVLDMDLEKDLVQGIALRASLSQFTRVFQEGKPILIGMCHRNLAAVSTEIPCHSAVETINPNTLTAETLWDLDAEGLFMNGPVYGGANDLFFANVEVKTGETSFGKRLVELNLLKKTSRTVVEFPEKSGGFWGGFQDPHNGKVYVGDTNQDGKHGRFIVIDGDKQVEVPLELAPYSGAFVHLK